MRTKLTCVVLSVLVAMSLCVSPYAGAMRAYANPLVLTGAEAAFATFCAALGLSVASNDDAKALFADWELYTEDIDAIAAQVSAMQDAAIETAQANGQLVNATKQQVSRDEIDAINAMFEAAGNAGSLALDNLSTVVSDGVLGILPFLMSLFISDQVSNVGNTDFVTNSVATIGSYNINFSNSYIYDSVVSAEDTYVAKEYSLASPTNWHLAYSHPDGFFYEWVSDNVRSSSDFQPITIWLNGVFQIHNSKFSWLGQIQKFMPGYRTNGSNAMPPNSYLNSQMNYQFVNSGGVIVASYINGVWSGNVTVTDNPDVNLGHDYWDDAKDRVDVLNPAAGAAVIGSDVVIDGDYIANRGSLGVITDWTDIKSWADALAKAKAGVVEGALDGTIGTTQTGTAVDVGTGELVTDTVGDLVKPDAGTSVSPAKPGFDWGKFLDPSLYLVFPFCLPWDLVDLVMTLSAEPQAPVIDWPMPTLSGQHTLHVDLAPWSPVATVLRMGELVAAAVGLIWITKTMIKM